MPEEPPPEAPTRRSIDSEFTVRNCHWCSNGQLMTVRLLLPFSVSDQELGERYQQAIADCRAWEERRRLEEEAQEELRLQEEEQAREANEAAARSRVKGVAPSQAKDFSQLGSSKAASKDVDIDAARAELEGADRKVQSMLARSANDPAETVLSPQGHLQVPLYDWDEPLKLLERLSLTPDKDLRQRGKDLYHQIRKNHGSQLRPVGYPLAAHDSVLAALRRLEQLMPHFAQVVAVVRHSLILSRLRWQPMRVPPILLLGDPGIGKTHFSIELAKVLKVPVHRHAFDSGITETALTGSDSRWANTATGLVFDALVLGPSASPVVLLDEIDKACRSERANPVAPLHTLLEPVSARAVTDISVNFTFDASHIVWIAAGNDAAGVPPAIRSRFREFVITAPQGEAAIQAAHVVARAVHARMGLALFDPPDKRIVVALAHLPARQQIQALETAFARALVNGDHVVQLHHLPASVLDCEPGPKAPPNGYLH